ncbi:MAG: hypothetical protein OXD49_17065 [Candidatus Poribacteria bacterium]|nr:hypothetical protein [Candidatus Poribacteria bacterium]
MTTNALKNIIARCHQRHEKPLKQRRSIVEPLLYKGLPYYFTVYCAHRYPVMLQDLETADISFMPIGHAPGNDRPPRGFRGERFLKRQQAKDWETLRWHKSWGIQVYTGIPSARDGALWHDIDFTYEAIRAAPDAVFACVEALVDAVANPLLTLSKSGGCVFLAGYPDTCTRTLSRHGCMFISTYRHRRIRTSTTRILKFWGRRDIVAGMRALKFCLEIC